MKGKTINTPMELEGIDTRAVNKPLSIRPSMNSITYCCGCDLWGYLWCLAGATLSEHPREARMAILRCQPQCGPPILGLG